MQYAYTYNMLLMHWIQLIYLYNDFTYNATCSSVYTKLKMDKMIPNWFETFGFTQEKQNYYKFKKVMYVTLYNYNDLLICQVTKFLSWKRNVLV